MLWAWLQHGSVSAALAYVKGDRLLVDVGAKTLAPMSPGEKKTVTFWVTNRSSEPITILGAKSSCTCTAAGDLPLTIPAGATRPVAVGIHAGPKPAVLDGTLKLFTDHPSKPVLTLRVKSMISGPAVASYQHKD